MIPHKESVVTFSKSTFLATLTLMTLAMGCAPKEPAELISARRAYEHARTSDAAALAPAELHVASEALAAAEASFDKNPKYYETVDLAYIAHRKAQMAEATASAEKANDAAAASAEALAAEQTTQLADAQDKLASSEKARLEAMAALAKLAAVKEEERGMVITLSGSVLFTSGQSTLLPSAQTKLDQVAEALASVKERPLLVEGHTDSQGSDTDNLALSQRRAEAVRTYLVQKGADPTMVTAQGIGEGRPVGENTTPEGRANNRRVEIVVQREPTNPTMP